MLTKMPEKGMPEGGGVSTEISRFISPFRDQRKDVSVGVGVQHQVCVTRIQPLGQ